MQLQGLMLALLMLIVIPVIMVSSNHNVFFVIFAIVLFIVSIRNIHYSLFKDKDTSKESEDESTEDLEGIVDINVRTIGDGITVLKSLLVILFLVYCTVFIRTSPLVWLIAFCFLLRLKNIIDVFKKKVGSPSALESKLNGFILILTDLSCVILIILVSYNKFINNIF